MANERSSQLFERARAVMPGGVSSPVRAFKSVGGEPRFIARGEGPWMWDVDGNRYIDYVGSWGPLILGHAHPGVIEAVVAAAAGGTSFGAPCEGEVRLCEKIVELVPSIEQVRLVSSGTEATSAALRLARAATGRELVLKLEGCYHGAADAFLVKAGSGVATLGLPDSPGVPAAVAERTLTVPFNDLQAVEEVFAARGSDIACLFVEPVVGNSGVLPPAPGFLEGLRRVCDASGALLVFDEVMTGFRLARGGAQERFGVRPDLTTMGKIIGGGLPVGAYGGRADLMHQIAPAGPVYQAGTLSGNPLAVAAGLACLEALAAPGVYERLETATASLCDGLSEQLRKKGVPFRINRVGSMWTLFFTDEEVRDFGGAKRSDAAAFGRLFQALLEEGVYLAPSAFEACFVSLAHDDEVIEQTVAAMGRALAKV